VRKCHAVVLGGGLAGRVTADAFKECYQRVPVVDRDPAPAPDDYRREDAIGLKDVPSARR
jgi:2-polyprenyl-6-methoxyphenol hydroxylase-like FAD-dependent oxidoreductase